MFEMRRPRRPVSNSRLVPLRVVMVGTKVNREATEVTDGRSKSDQFRNAPVAFYEKTDLQLGLQC